MQEKKKKKVLKYYQYVNKLFFFFFSLNLLLFIHSAALEFTWKQSTAQRKESQAAAKNCLRA